MKLVKTASGKKKLKISKKEWKNIGKKAGWMKVAYHDEIKPSNHESASPKDMSIGVFQENMIKTWTKDAGRFDPKYNKGNGNYSVTLYMGEDGMYSLDESDGAPIEATIVYMYYPAEQPHFGRDYSEPGSPESVDVLKVIVAGEDVQDKVALNDVDKEILENKLIDSYRSKIEAIAEDAYESEGELKRDTEDMYSDVDADSMTLRDAGWGTDEDYGSASDML